MWVTLGVVCVDGYGGMFPLRILMCFAKGDVGVVVMSLFRAWVCRVSKGYVLHDEVWRLAGEVGAIDTSRNFVSTSLSPCSLRMSDALCGMGVNWMVHS